jgi:hypothetical protein
MIVVREKQILQVAILMSLPPIFGSVVGRAVRERTGLHPSVGQASMEYSSASRLNRKESKIFT